MPAIITKSSGEAPPVFAAKEPLKKMPSLECSTDELYQVPPVEAVDLLAPINGSVPSPVELDFIPQVGFDTFSNFNRSDAVYHAVLKGIEEGYRFFDLAAVNENEDIVGRAINDAINAGRVQRHELFVTSKLWCSDQAPEDVEAACRRSLKRIGVDYLDAYLIHWPTRWTKESRRLEGAEFKYESVHKGDRQSIAATYAAMEKLVDKGLVKSLGVSNFSCKQLGDLLVDCAIPPKFSEFERHPFLKQQKLINLCSYRGIRVIAFCPLGNSKSGDSSEPSLFNDPVIQKVADECKRTPAQVVLRWNVQAQNVTVIPQAGTEEEISENFDICGWALTDDQMQQLDELNRNHRYVNVDWWEFSDEDNSAPEDQPTLLPGMTTEEGAYVNAFYRDNKPLCSTIIIERGCLNNIDKRALDWIPQRCHTAKNYLVTDEIVDPLYGDTVMEGFARAGLQVQKIVIPAEQMDEAGEPSSETSKTLQVFSKCCDQILAGGISKHSCIVSLGGGVVNNLCGFMAASLYRGITLVHITTSMMGMTDAAIDFKQAVNHVKGKNLIGAYYPASSIIIDPDTLRTLSKRHIVNGIAEAIKHALAQSMELVNEIVDPFRKHGKEALADLGYLETVCRTCIDYKVPTLIHYQESDFNEMVPQYGHAIGHAVEHLSFHVEGVQPLLHGEAVSIGMCITAELAHILGICSAEVVDQHYEFLSTIFLPVCVPEQLTPDMIMRKIVYDKHYVKKPTIGLLTDIGRMYSTEDGKYGLCIEKEDLVKAIDANILRRQSNKKFYSSSPL